MLLSFTVAMRNNFGKVFSCRNIKTLFNEPMHNNNKLLGSKCHTWNQNVKKFISKRNFSTSFYLMKGEINKYSDKNNDSLSLYQNHEDITNRIYRQPGMPHNVLVIQPKINSGPNYEKMKDSEYKLAEAVALVHTLPQWRVKKKYIISTSSIKSKFILGSGNLDKLKCIIQRDESITAVFLGMNIMTALQNATLENYFKIPVFDRYQIILQIFHDHAHTKEAKLQLALAEIPYLRVKLASYLHTRDSSHFPDIHRVGGDGETYVEKRKQILNERELKLKKELEKVKNQRELLRRSEMRSSLPLIAVVGYTNCGKTTLIKALTKDTRLLPQDKLFATLDVTLHAGMLPSNQKALFIDTVGFISDVPTTLIQSFKSTLEEITLADLVIHVRDISHPDTENQKETVLKTLQELDLPQKLMNSILEVKNKSDLLESITEEIDSEALHISATEGIGLPQLLEAVEQKLFENSGYSVSLLRIPNGGKEYSWLMKEGGVRDAIIDVKDANYLIIEVVLSSANLAKFKHEFGDLTVNIKDLTN